jgi:hypothetical protein
MEASNDTRWANLSLPFCMVRNLVTRALAAGFILVMSAGGGNLPAFDTLLYHRREAGPPVMSHVEKQGACHADQCTLRSAAAHHRMRPVPISRQILEIASPDSPISVVTPPLGPPPALTQPFSRAPPSLLA